MQAGDADGMRAGGCRQDAGRGCGQRDADGMRAEGCRWDVGRGCRQGDAGRERRRLAPSGSCLFRKGNASGRVVPFRSASPYG